MTKEAGFANTLVKLKESISAYDHIVSAIDHELKADVPDETDFFEDKLDHASRVLGRIRSLKAELDEIRGSSQTQQKIRIYDLASFVSWWLSLPWLFSPPKNSTE